jgi:hypothetical protein
MLSVNVEMLGRNSSQGEMFSRELFPNLSHVDFVLHLTRSFSLAVDQWSWLHDLPALTHISLGDLFPKEHLHVFELLRHLLTECELLQTLNIVSNDSFFLLELQNEDIHDLRLVILPNFCYPKSLKAYWEGIRRGELGMG